MTDYKARQEREERLATQLQTLFSEIASRMPGWTVKPADPDDGNTWRRYVLQRGDMGIHIHRDTNGKGDRVNISTWHWPSYSYIECGDERRETVSPHNLYDPKESSPSITCAMDRGADAIVKEIQRRFLPEYERLYARCKAKVEESRAFHDKSQDSWRSICETIKADQTRDRHYFGPLTIERRSNGARVEVDLGAEALAKLIAAMGYTNKKV